MKNRYAIRFLGAAAWFCLGTIVSADGWTEHIRPLLKENCTKCHGGVKQKGGLDLRMAAKILKGGESGPAFVPGKPGESLLFQVIQPDVDADLHMPPKKQLDDSQIELLREWILDYDVGSGSEPSEGTLPIGVEPGLAIDVLLQKSWAESGTTPSPPIDDSAFVRRIYLDLVARIPTESERRFFLMDTRSDKRDHLVDSLLASPAHANHLAEVFNVALLGRELNRHKKREDRERHLLPYLRWAFSTNRPWNVIGRDLLVARPTSPEERGASWFLYEQQNDPNKMAETASAALFGHQVQCAQCHDHPIAPEIEQRHYWGLVAFFSRSINVTTKDGPRVAERASGGYAEYANLEGKTDQSELVFFTGAKVEEPGGRREEEALEHYVIAPPSDWMAAPKEEKAAKKKEKGKKDKKLTTRVDQAPVPIFSRREQLADLAIEQNPGYARAMINRMWALLMGRGIVHPVNRMDSTHPASHPELLNWLTKDFEASGYDVRRLVRAIVSSRAYALSSRHPEGSRPQPSTFAYALDKPLPAEALYRSMLVALGAKVGTTGNIAGENAYRSIFVQQYPDLFVDVFSPNVQQALFATNSDTIDAMLHDEKLPLVNQLEACDSDAAVVSRVFRAVLGREPDETEKARGVEFLGRHSDQRAETIRQFVWALFAGAEFQLNH